ncbi:ACP S-malonyltransferase [Alkalibaculum sp. M08DMB]|uniref:Malonyl CoA-acyl carrier protein transacylase n=1 Tax=Alkalibaculum sporogenes TaxID=2655001 RepID=A0A6A7KAH0_9FIRM|nr:ACP S-malonyltransferase [Alkalibaculum sporogenes]MPW26386.1 ACP S-malonyltransferase [Alkalibaculum sporogenes]
MKNIAFLFPGQGSQYKGMGKDLYDNFSEARQVFELADASLPFKISEICFEDPNNQINQTRYTQPAILTTSIAALTLLKKSNVQPQYCAGLSLGEYSALVASNIVDLETALSLVFNRGTFMEEAVPNGQGAMAAIIGLENHIVEDICGESSHMGVVEPANYNYSGQVVIGGESQAVEYACSKFESSGAKKVVKLNVSGPFHTSLLKNAAQKLDEYMDGIQLNMWNVPVISNVTANPYNDLSSLKDLLVNQVISPVKWEDSIKYMIENGITHFIEIGPGRVLSGFVKRIDRNIKVLNIEDTKSFENTMKVLGG